LGFFGHAECTFPPIVGSKSINLVAAIILGTVACGANEGSIPVVEPAPAPQDMGAAPTDMAPAPALPDLAAKCGNGVVEPGEPCDDGNSDEYDGCTSQCKKGAMCSGTMRSVDPATGHCYLLIDTMLRLYSDARYQCAQRNGYLAVLSGAAENERAKGLLTATQKAWIGLEDVAHNSHFVWSTAEPFSYTSWKPSEPNNGTGNEYCVWMGNNGLWDDDACTDSFLTLCEIPPQ
jgi:cysteine-rich repeat protein